MKLSTLAPLVLVGIASALGFSATPAEAATCVPLKAIGVEKAGPVRKKVEPPGTLVSNNNWNIDFPIGSNQNFDFYRVRVWSINDSNYDVKVFLKYSDNTSDKPYDLPDFTIPRKKPFQVDVKPRSFQEQPFQLNAFVGGIVAVGNEYSVAAYGCRR